MPDLTIKKNKVRQCCRLRASTEEETDVNAFGTVKEKRVRKKTQDALEVVVIGLSHHNAKVDIREKLAIPEDQWNDAATVRYCFTDSTLD